MRERKREREREIGGGRAEQSRFSGANTSSDLGRYVSKVMINTIVVIERAASDAHGRAEGHRRPPRIHPPFDREGDPPGDEEREAESGRVVI